MEDLKEIVKDDEIGKMWELYETEKGSYYKYFERYNGIYKYISSSLRGKNPIYYKYFDEMKKDLFED